MLGHPSPIRTTYRTLSGWLDAGFHPRPGPLPRWLTVGLAATLAGSIVGIASLGAAYLVAGLSPGLGRLLLLWLVHVGAIALAPTIVRRLLNWLLPSGR